MSYSSKFSSILVEAIEEGLSSMCNSAASSVLFYLKSNGAVRSESQIESLEKFSKTLSNIFGFGSKVIERQILKVLHIKLQLSPIVIPEQFQLVEEIDKAFDLYSRTHQSGE